MSVNRQAVLDVLNGLDVIEACGGDEPYILVENSEENREKLRAVGVQPERLRYYGDDETFCILALAFGDGYANGFRDGKLVHDEPAPCKKCGFEDEFINDYNEEGEEYTFCGNCGTVVE
jgi:hypothetical protein